MRCGREKSPGGHLDLWLGQVFECGSVRWGWGWGEEGQVWGKGIRENRVQLRHAGLEMSKRLWSKVFFSGSGPSDPESAYLSPFCLASHLFPLSRSHKELCSPHFIAFARAILTTRTPPTPSNTTPLTSHFTNSFSSFKSQPGHHDLLVTSPDLPSSRVTAFLCILIFLSISWSLPVTQVYLSVFKSLP